ncbi:hypothetical protein OG780_42885 [Streptomyces sp. NBC_00386]|uniref:hypothetical protein n=1 Tax=Streptomyces sp. NBC_00386 TaxID=2975734 RepID=UPI002E22EE5E
MADLAQWIRGRAGIVSIDADFFTNPPEQRLLPPMRTWLTNEAAGAPVAFRTEHVDLVDLVPRPVEFLINFDFHMDCRVEFLHGDPPKCPPCSASVFETLLSDGLIERYIWAFPAVRRTVAARVFSSAVITGRQPLLSRIHGIEGRDMAEALTGIEVESVFVCRSPSYATVTTDAIYDDLQSLTPTAS